MNKHALTLLLLLLPTSLLAGNEITLRQALDLLLHQAPEQTLVDARQSEARAVLEQAEGLLAAPPTLTLGAQGGREDGSFGEYREWRAGVELPLWRPGQSDAHRQLAMSIDGLAREDMRALQLDLAGQLREAAWQVVLAQASAKALQVASEETRHALDRLKRLVALGERPRADLVTLEGEILDLDQQLASARAETRLALASWRMISRQDAPPALPLETAAAEQPIETHPLWAQARLALERAKAERRTGTLAAKGSPTLGMEARHEEPPGSPALDTISLNLNLPLPWERHRQVAETALRYAETEAAVRLARIERELMLARQQAALGLESAQLQAQMAEKRALAAREERRLASRRLEEGEMDIIDYVSVLRRTLDAERTAQLGRLEVGRWIARHNQAQGVLP
ncbi:MAG: TolC family protein [Halothiobacillaceae bacterium]